MVTAADVYLWGQKVGTVLWNENRVCANFEYTPDYVRSGLEISPLMMPLAQKIYSFPDRDSYKTFLGLQSHGRLDEHALDVYQ